MFFLFYLKYPPSIYQQYSQSSSGGFRENHIFGKYEFRTIEWDQKKKKDRTLYVGRPEDFPENVTVLERIFFLNGKSAIYIVAN